MKNKQPLILDLEIANEVMDNFVKEQKNFKKEFDNALIGVDKENGDAVIKALMQAFIKKL